MLDLTILTRVLMVVLAVSLALAGYRMLRGPGYADRFVALDMLTAVVVAFCALTALATGHGAFVDVGLGAALINFVSTCAFATFLERRGGGR
ncbi:MAG TPA: monovalent cation/H+ antiporter complex subunit F [Gemmatimonadaceae bacterium]|jgi:multicomponent Na+:H+ antiporter subunit F|nr:monovalent cation/H+ antiporter complex subunit F [Gemmatimonadaceae bacterium]